MHVTHSTANLCPPELATKLNAYEARARDSLTVCLLQHADFPGIFKEPEQGYPSQRSILEAPLLKCFEHVASTGLSPDRIHLCI